MKFRASEVETGWMKFNRFLFRCESIRGFSEALACDAVNTFNIKTVALRISWLFAIWGFRCF